MLLSEAIALLESGEKVRRGAWNIEEGYLVLLPGMGHIWKIVLHPNPNAGNYIFSVADLKGDDWVAFELPKQLIDAAYDASVGC